MKLDGGPGPLQHPWPPGDSRVANGTYEAHADCLNCGASRLLIIGKGRPVPNLPGEGPVCDYCGCKTWKRHDPDK